MLLVGGPKVETAHRELVQSKTSPAEYIAARARLSFRNPVADARVDAARGDRSLYCVGTIGCFPPGLDVPGPFPENMEIHATATTGCVITGGDSEMSYRDVEENYVRAYNRAKVTALPGFDVWLIQLPR